MQLFKFVLDEDFLQEALYRNPDGAPDIDDVRAWYRDFLTNLHEHILSHLKAVLQVNSKLTKVDYVFSLPTVWGENNRIVERFGDILGEAGFGSGERSSVIIGLTEAEASAVQTAVSGGVKYKVRWALHPHNIVFRLTLGVDCRKGTSYWSVMLEELPYVFPCSRAISESNMDRVSRSSRSNV
jgi:hypothetical protein